MDGAVRRNMLSDPLAWVRQHGVVVSEGALAGLLEQRQQLLERQHALELASRQLSKAIGAAKAQGVPFAELLERKRVVSAEEKALRGVLKEREAGIVTLLTAAPAGNDDRAIAPPAAGEAGTATAAAASAAAATAAAEHAIDLAALVVSVVTGPPAADWDDFVGTHADATVYHLSAFKRIVEDSFGHDTLYLQARSHGTLQGLLPLVRLQSRLFGDFLVSMPFFNYGGVLARSDAVAEQLLQYARTVALEQGCSHIEYRHLRPRPGLPLRDDKVAMWLALPPTEAQLWRALGSKLRSQIKRAERFDLSVDCGGVELLDDFYQVFAHNMRDLGTPVYARQFFHNIMTSPLPDKRLVIVRRGGEPVSAALLIGFRDRMEVPWASTLRSANRFDANMFLYWELLRQACGSGYRLFDFGRSTRDAPTYRFKKQWGAEPRQLYWHYWLAAGGEPPRMNPDNPKYRAVIALWQRLPVWLTRLVGPHIVKYLP